MEHMSCIYNPVTSRERLWAELKPAEKPKRVVIVGAGPAGMEAALVAHGRGHKVLVLEKSDQVGGQVHLAAAAPLRANLIRIAKFYRRQAAKGLFEVRLSTEARAEDVVALAPEAVVVATGSVPRRVEVAGGGRVWTVHEAVTHDLDGNKRGGVVDGHGAMEALAAADRLSADGVRVDFVTPFRDIAPGVESMTLTEMLRRVSTRSISFSEGDDVVFWDGREALIRNTYTGVERSVDGLDAVVIAAGADPVNDLALALRGRVPELHTIGDANQPRTIEEATVQGGSVGRIL